VTSVGATSSALERLSEQTGREMAPIVRMRRGERSAVKSPLWAPGAVAARVRYPPRERNWTEPATKSTSGASIDAVKERTRLDHSDSPLWTSRRRRSAQSMMRALRSRSRSQEFKRRRPRDALIPTLSLTADHWLKPELHLLHFARVVQDAKCIAVTHACVSVCPRPHVYTIARIRM